MGIAIVVAHLLCDARLELLEDGLDVDHLGALVHRRDLRDLGELLGELLGKVEALVAGLELLVLELQLRRLRSHPRGHRRPRLNERLRDRGDSRGSRRELFDLACLVEHQRMVRKGELKLADDRARLGEQTLDQIRVGELEGLLHQARRDRGGGRRDLGAHQRQREELRVRHRIEHADRDDPSARARLRSRRHGRVVFLDFERGLGNGG